MASTRPIRLDQWGISWEEYKELCYFCLQYEQKKRDADALLTLRLSTPTPETWHKGGKEFGAFMPRGGGKTSDPVAATAARRDKLLRDVRMIEEAARVAGRLKDGFSIYDYLLKAVTTKTGVKAILEQYDRRKKPPCSKSEFYAARRMFFWVLREMKNGEWE